MMERKWLKKDTSKKGERAELAGVASKLFSPVEKSPYHRGEKAIRNFKELKRSLNEFTEKEAQWIASWIEYLGDIETATKIRRTPSRFREIITARFNELQPYVT